MTKTLSDSSVFVAYQRQAESGTSSNEEENPVHTKLKPKPRKKNRKKKASEKTLLKELAMCKMDNKKGTKNTAVRKPSKEPDATNVTANTADYIAPKIQDSHRIQAKMATSFAKAEKTELAPSPPQDLEASSVSAHMSELLLTKKQNAQLLENQQILIEANAKINEQYRQSQETIANLRDELIFLRQMCLSSQNEVSLLKAASSTPSVTNTDSHGNSRKIPCRPPPGIL
ncbi:unnamed protein product [Albugo candida]|uniref:Uncharacterized protein n=1 Tax=Albugo candida TaxID=65357 RepID=A0A024GCQ3_9STRA|nr:unnamed protein product [Albugo candida]|eukprot:CCI44112.1 unnamed protein product [Albugo candida]